jgi:CBS domain-containing protein
MATIIRDHMTTDLVCMDVGTLIPEAARAMAEADIGDVIVTRDGKLRGLVTDRDIVVRCLARNHDPRECTLESVCSEELATLTPEATVDEAVRLMKKHAVRRIPIVEAGRPVGILSLGDLAVERSPHSALGEISAAVPSH